MVEPIIRDILQSCGDLSVPAATLDRHADLYDAGLSSFGTVEVMVAMEERFGAIFPEALLTRATFGSIAALCGAAEQLAQLAPAG